MDPKTLGTIQLIGGLLAFFSSFGFGFMGGMMFFGGWGVTILAALFVITGIHHLTEVHKKH